MVERLDPIYREALTLTDLGDLSQAEAARRAGITSSAMKARVQRARAQLRDAVSACCAVHTDAAGRVHDVDARPCRAGGSPESCVNTASSALTPAGAGDVAAQLSLRLPTICNACSRQNV